MIKTDLDKNLSQYYGRFSENHDDLREELVSSLGRSETFSFVAGLERAAEKARLPVRWVMTAAAVVAIALGAAFLADVQSRTGNSQTAWAAAIENAGNLQSVHFRFGTPSASSDSSVEMWWRRPHDFRMEFSNGLVVTGNAQQRNQLNPRSKALTVHNAAQKGVEMMPLGELGQLFASKVSVSADWIEHSQVVSSEEILFRGKKCRKIVAQKDGNWYVYVIDARVSNAGEAPLLYEVKRYGDASMQRLQSQVEVMETNRAMPDSLFVIDPAKANKVIDRRGAVKKPLGQSQLTPPFAR